MFAANVKQEVEKQIEEKKLKDKVQSTIYRSHGDWERYAVALSARPPCPSPHDSPADTPWALLARCGRMRGDRLICTRTRSN